MSRREWIKLVLGVSLLLNLLLVILFMYRQSSANRLPPVSELAGENSAIEVAYTSADVSAVEPTSVVTIAAPTATPTSKPTATATVVATTGVLPSPTPEPTAMPTVMPTATLEPTVTTAPSPTPTPVAVVGPEWLGYVNLFRQQANLPPLVENIEYSLGSAMHSTYMMETDHISHYEERTSSHFTEEGDLAAQKGNLVVSFVQPPYQWAIEYWISSPFHALPILDPRLHTVGFGLVSQPEGDTTMAAVMDVLQGVGEVPPDVTYPILFPRDGGQTWVIRHSLYEWPDPYASCPGYAAPSGPPIMLQMGTGENTPQVTGRSFRKGDVELEHCIFSETTYVNSDPRAQEVGRNILDKRDAIVLMPRAELEMGQTYTVTLVVNGEAITWSFQTVPPPWRESPATQ